jgi:type I restriction enzyme S subunit
MSDSHEARLDHDTTVLGINGWRESFVGEEVEFTKKPKGFSIAPTQKIPFVPMELLPDDGLYTKQYELRTPDKIPSGVFFEEGDLLLAKITPCLENGKQAIATEIPGGWGFATTEVFPIKPRRLDAEFLAFFFKWRDVRQVLASKMQGATGRQRLPRETLEAFPISIPPPPEQKAIAHVLRTVQQAKGATEKVIAATRQLKQSLMKHLFTYGPVPFDQADKVELKETEIGSIPIHWSIAELSNLISEDIKNGAFFKRNHFKNGTIPFLNVADTYKSVAANFSGVERVQCKEHEVDAYALKNADVIYVRSSLKREGIGHCCIVTDLTEPAIYDCHLMRVRTDSTKLDATYLTFFSLSEPGKRELIARSKTTTMTTLNQKGLGSFRVPLPPLEDQVKIQKSLSVVENKIAAEETRRQQMDILFQSILHHLMTGKVRLPVDDDQPVAEAV